MIRFFKRWFPAKDELNKPGKAIKQAVSMLRREYDGIPWDVKSADPDPMKQFAIWFDIAVEKIQHDPNAMILGTVSRDGQPSTRTVLLKGYDEDGFIFYTNYESRKGRHLTDNNKASLTFYWPDLMRQIHIEGSVETVSEDVSDAYFKTRPDGSKLSAWASNQSEVVDSRLVLENRLHSMEKRFKGEEIPRPPYWGGFRLIPNRIEFWQGRLNRLHDRICYRLVEGRWVIERLGP